MNKLVWYLTYFNRPKRVQTWWRAHPKTTIASDLFVIAILVRMWVKLLRED